MQDILEPLIHKAPVQNLRLHLGRSGLSIGDSAQLSLLADGKIGIFAQARKPWAGVFLRRSLTQIGELGPAASAILLTPLQQGHYLRIRIVGLTPEHLASGAGPELFISVWSNAHKLMQPPLA